MGLNLGVTTFSREVFHFSVESSYAIGFSIVLIFGFVLCRYRVFKATSENIRRQFLKFAATSVFFRGLEFAICYGLFKAMGAHYFLALVTVQVGSFFIKFFYYRAIVFSPGGKAST